MYLHAEKFTSSPKTTRKIALSISLQSSTEQLGRTEGECRGKESNVLFSTFLLPGCPLYLLITYYFNPLLTICSDLPPPKKPQTNNQTKTHKKNPKHFPFFLIFPGKSQPEHQGEICVPLALCGLPAVTRDHLETITQANNSACA